MTAVCIDDNHANPIRLPSLHFPSSVDTYEILPFSVQFTPSLEDLLQAPLQASLDETRESLVVK